MTKNAKTSFLINLLFYTVVALFVYLGVRFLFIYLFPFLIGLAVTVLVQKPAAFTARKLKINKGFCAVFYVVLCYIIISCTIVFAVFKLSGYIIDLVSEYNNIFSSVAGIVSNITDKVSSSSKNMPEFITDFIEKSVNNITKSLSDYLSAAAKSTAKFMPLLFTSCIVTVIASCYISKDYDRFKYSIGSVVSGKYKLIFSELKDLTKNNVFKIVKGYLIVLLITFVELLVGLLLLGSERAVQLAMIISLLDLLPVIGTGTVLIPWGIYKIFIGDYFFGAGLLMLYLIISIVRNIIEPKIIGKQIGLHPLITLIAVFLGFRFFGLGGIFIFPFAVMVVWKMYERGIFSMLFTGDIYLSEQKD